ncbi:MULTISPECIES: hypothetical protein [unclassified Sphaerospermopsis]|uniref:hypothetical protein n=1 Tax=unclassified Sphaerospermopsis TaxID=2646443 RepID=UPI00164E9CBF|nr:MULTISPECIES: hypothetical protein [unclassified Sphaerospermopsis]MBC5794916.1 hypothetical protein [Sphaerospermopsis sp. LEGE 00249]MBD2145456.1 hypothetical protein [Sphaerospermopsis sp. FACHB-1194]
MAAIMNTELHSVQVNGLFQKLTLEEMESTSGGNTVIPLWSSGLAAFSLNMFCDELNSLFSEYYIPPIFNDNKLFTVDFSEIDVYLVV